MIEPTTELLGKTVFFTILYGIVVILFTIYSLYLNWKQSKVADTQKRQIELLEQILQELKK